MASNQSAYYAVRVPSQNHNLERTDPFSRFTFHYPDHVQNASQNFNMVDLGEAKGCLLSNGCRITHGQGALVKKPFPDMALTMHELTSGNGKGFSGQLGFIEFDTTCRLPRHIHMDMKKTKLTDERILVLNGVGMVEIAGKLWVVAPGSLVDAVGGVPHTWTACPPGIKLPNGQVSDGRFTMVYEYEEPTSFFPTASTVPITDTAQYVPFDGDLDEIRFPKLSAEDVVMRSQVVIDQDVRNVQLVDGAL